MEWYTGHGVYKVTNLTSRSISVAACAIRPRRDARFTVHDAFTVERLDKAVKENLIKIEAVSTSNAVAASVEEAPSVPDTRPELTEVPSEQSTQEDTKKTVISVKKKTKESE